jgi:hypothetical protein
MRGDRRNIRPMSRGALALTCCAACAGHFQSDPPGPDAGEPTADAPTGDAPAEPAFDSLPWQVIGTGVSFKDSQNPRGEDAFIAYAGYEVTDDEARTWTTALYDAWLRDHGVRYVYAVRGPADVEYTQKEIENTHLIAHLLPEVTSATHFIAIAGHSSGGWVACEMLQQLYDQGLDPTNETGGKTVYYDLDGVESCLDTTILLHLRNAYFVSAHTNVGGGGYSLNAANMMAGAMMFGKPFELYDASASGCEPSADMCLHVSLINTKPHDPTTGTPTDYGDFMNRPVNHWYLDATVGELPQ